MGKAKNQTKGRPSAADAHLLSSAEAFRMWLGESRGEALGANRVAAMMIALAAEGYVNAALLTLLNGADFIALRSPAPWSASWSTQASGWCGSPRS